MLVRVGVTVVAVACLAVPQFAAGATIGVTTTKDEFDTGAKCALREAVEAANTNASFGGCPKGQGSDTIALGAKSYKLSIDVDGSAEDANEEGDLDVDSSLTITGEGSTNTRIEGNGSKLQERAIHQLSGNLAVKNLTIRDAVEYEGSSDGGAIFNEGSGKLSVAGVRLLDNYTYYSGGGIASYGDDTKVTNSRIADNECDDYGGGVYYDGPETLLVKETTVSGNQCDDGVGAIWAEQGDFKLISSTVTQNAGYDYAGGIDVDGARVVINKSTIAHNYNYTSYGGALYDEGVDEEIVLRNSTIANNHAASYGGGLYLYSPTVIENSTFTRNIAYDSGGGIYMDGGDLSMNNVTLAGNFSYNGSAGGIDANGYTVEFSNSIIARNRYYGDLGWVNDCAGTTTSLGHNLLGTDTCDGSGTGDISGTTSEPLDPRLAPLGKNGGPTETRALLSGSDAIDAGGNDCEPKDQRGHGRGANCDIGAFEK
jgi:CSLREA domain-containing protein